MIYWKSAISFFTEKWCNHHHAGQAQSIGHSVSKATKTEQMQIQSSNRTIIGHPKKDFRMEQNYLVVEKTYKSMSIWQQWLGT
ncbi:MAG: hypothetical protein ACK5KP_09880 [Paludibacteraceae bacterium]